MPDPEMFGLGTFTLYRFPGLPQPELSPIGAAYMYFDDVLGQLRTSMNGAAYVDVVGGGGGGSTLAAVLATGNTTGANDIIVSAGQAINGATALPLSAAAGSDLTLNARGSGPIPLNQAGEVTLDAIYTGLGRTSLIGALNALVDGTITPGTPPLSSVLAVGNTTGAFNVVVSSGQKVVSAAASALTLDGTTTLDLQSGATTRWQVTAAGHLFPGATDNTEDIGGSATNRIRTLYAGTSVVVGATVTVNGVTNTITGSTGLALASAAGNVVANATGGIVDLQIGSTSRWQVSALGNLLASTDATNDIGAAGANRPNNAHVANSVVVATTLTVSGVAVTATGALSVAAGAAADLALSGRGASTNLNQAGETALDVAFTGAGRTSLIGALNSLVDGTVTPNAPALSAVLAVGNTTGANDILITGGQEIDSATAVPLNIGTTTATIVQVGAAAVPVSMPGDVTVGGNLTVNGTTTTINSTNTTIADQILLIAAGAPVQVFSAYTIERGASGDDLLFLWNPTDARTEIGFFDTVGGTVAPAAALTTLSDLRANNLLVAGTAITADAALTVASTGATNDLNFTGRGVTTALNQAGETTLDVAFTGAGRTSLIGALNSLVDGTVPTSSTWAQVLANGASSGANNPSILTGQRLEGSAELTFRANGVGTITFQTTGATNRWSIASAGNFLASTDNTLDIGAAGANRPQRVYVGTEVVVGNTITIGSSTIASSTTLGLTSADGTGGGAGSVLAATAGAGNGVGAGGALSMSAGAGGATANGGIASLTGGAGGGTSGNGGVANVVGGTPVDGNGGGVTLIGHAGVGTNRNGGDVAAFAGNATGTGTAGGFSFVAGTGGTTTAGGNVTLTGGTGGATNGAGGAINLSAGTAVGTGTGGALNLSAGTSPTGTGGEVVVQTGDAAPATRMRVLSTGLVGIGSSSPSSTLHVQGSLAARTTSISSGTTLDSTTTIVLANAAGGGFTVTLPAASTALDRIYHVKKTDSSLNVVTIARTGADTIDGATTQTLVAQYDSLQFVSDGTDWWLI